METYGSMIAYGTEDLSVFDWKVAEGDVKLEKGTCIGAAGWQRTSLIPSCVGSGTTPSTGFARADLEDYIYEVG
jgi:hypothetical protein